MAVPPDGNIRVKAFEADNEAAPVAVVDYPAPVMNPLNATINVPNPVAHIVKIYDSPGASDGTLLADFVYDPSFRSVEIRPDKYYVVGSGTGNAPAEGDTALADADLKDYDYDVEIRGTGTMRSDGSEIEIDPDGGFSLTREGDQFWDDQVIIIHFAPKVSAVTPSQSNTSLIKGEMVVTADTTLDNTYFNQLINIKATANKITLTLPALSSAPALTLLPFVSNQGSQVNAIIKAAGSDLILWTTGPRTAMYLGRNEQLWLMKGADGWLVIQAAGDFTRVGQQVWGDIVLPNTLRRDGALLDRAVYPRLFNDYVLNLPPSALVTEANWASGVANQSFFTLGNGSTTFRIPNSQGLFIRALDNGRGIDTGRNLSGSYQADDLKSHSHQVKEIANGNLKPGSSTDESIGDWTAPSPIHTYNTGPAGGTETRPKNEAKIPLIIV